MIYLTTSLLESQRTGPSVLRRFVWSPAATTGVVIISFHPTAANTNTVKLFSRAVARHMYNTWLARGSKVQDSAKPRNSTGRSLCNEMSVALSLIRSDLSRELS